jgi:signal transduction histidine kinase
MDANETTIYYAVLITGFLIGCIIFYLGFSVIRYQRRHLQMQRGYFLTEIDSIEKDRTRIAHDLHDDLGPLLSVAQIRMRSLKGCYEADRENLEGAIRNIETVLERLGGIASNLTPKSLLVKGLEFALHDFIEQLKCFSGVEVMFTFTVQSPVASNTSIHIYRMVQEVMHNVIKHSGAEQVRLHLYEKGKSLFIFCRDNGRGFQFDAEINQSRGIGLKSLRNRIVMVGGKMHCYSEPGKGTEYLFEIPLQATNESAS